MKRASKVSRRVELALLILGVVLLDVVLGDALLRWKYQQREERALIEGLARPVPVAKSPIAAVPDHGSNDVVGPSDPSLPVTTPAAGSPVSPTASSAAPSGATKKHRSESLDPSAVGRLEIPRLGVRAIVREGADEGTLSRAVGLVRGTAHPGELGNMVLAGHRDTFFRPLRGIRVDDRIRIVVPPDAYEYSVESTRIVDPAETDVLSSRGVEELTLVTCYPFYFIGPAPRRLIVSAKRVHPVS